MKLLKFLFFTLFVVILAIPANAGDEVMCNKFNPCAMLKINGKAIDNEFYVSLGASYEWDTYVNNAKARNKSDIEFDSTKDANVENGFFIFDAKKDSIDFFKNGYYGQHHTTTGKISYKENFITRSTLVVYFPKTDKIYVSKISDLNVGDYINI